MTIAIRQLGEGKKECPARVLEVTADDRPWARWDWWSFGTTQHNRQDG